MDQPCVGGEKVRIIEIPEVRLIVQPDMLKGFPFAVFSVPDAIDFGDLADNSMAVSGSDTISFFRVVFQKDSELLGERGLSANTPGAPSTGLSASNFVTTQRFSAKP